MKLITRFSKAAIAFSSIFLGMIGEAQSQVVINELQAPNIIELKNIGSTTQDISSYWLCDRPSYIQVNNSTLTIDGDLDLSPGEIVTITGFDVIDGAGGEMGLFSSSSFGSSAAIIDYVIWGAPSTSNRETVALDAGIWTSGALASTFSSNQSLQYFGSDNLVSNYSALDATIGLDNCNPEAGTVSLDADATKLANPSTAVDGNTAIICIDSDTAPVAVTKTGQNTSLSYRYVITDDQNKILNITNTNNIDLTIAGEGTCRIWGWSYRGTPENGADFIDGPLADLEAVNCSDISDNWITVIRVAPEAGTVSLDADATKLANPSTAVDENTAIICIDSDTAPVAVTKTGHQTNLSYRYVITDDQNKILNITNTNNIDLTIAGEGTCRIWGWSYRGTPNNGADFIDGPLADLEAVNCSDISDNWITVIRVAPEAGTINIDADATGNPNGTTTINENEATILVDGQADAIIVKKTGEETNLSYRYVITDEDNKILNIMSSNSINLDSAGPGTCRIWGWSYRGTPENGAGFINGPLANLEAVNCSDISDNFITVNRLESLGAKIVINETDGDNIVQLKNIGTASLDISSYWLCNFPTYIKLSDLSIDGDLDLAPGETVDILNFTAINKDDSELGLYNTNLFDNTDAIVDYIEWGSTGHKRSAVAVSAGTWTEGDFIASFPENDFIVYDGEGETAADYTLNSTLSTEDFISNSVTVELFPNPVVETLNISNSNYSSGDRVSLYDLSGKIVLSQSLEGENSTVNVNALSSGVYILEYSTTSGDSTTRKIVKQ